MREKVQLAHGTSALSPSNPLPATARILPWQTVACGEVDQTRGLPGVKTDFSLHTDSKANTGNTPLSPLSGPSYQGLFPGEDTQETPA